MAKRSAEESESDESSLVSPRHKRVAPRQPKRGPPPPLYRASIEQVADTGDVVARTGADAIEDDIIQRIKKCLARANHLGSTEREAQAALLIANREMKRYNVTQAEVLEHESPEARLQCAGSSVVTIQRTDGNESKPVLHQTYVDDIISAMLKFFVCKCYTTKRRSSLDVTFYGIGQNTTSAAYSFEMVYNQVNDWAQAYKGGNPRNSYLLGISWSLFKMSVKESDREEQRAREAEVEVLLAREKQEQKERQEQLDRLAALPDLASSAPTQVEDISQLALKQEPDETDSVSTDLYDTAHATDSDDDVKPSDVESHLSDFTEPDFDIGDEDDLDPYTNLEDELQRLVKTDPDAPTTSSTAALWPSPFEGGNSSAPARQFESTLSESRYLTVKEETQDAADGASWASHMQLVTFRDTASKIADDWLVGTGRKLKSATGRKSIIRDKHAYERGRKDGKKIDVRRQRIEGSL